MTASDRSSIAAAPTVIALLPGRRNRIYGEQRSCPITNRRSRYYLKSGSRKGRRREKEDAIVFDGSKSSPKLSHLPFSREDNLRSNVDIRDMESLVDQIGVHFALLAFTFLLPAYYFDACRILFDYMGIIHNTQRFHQTYKSE